MDYVKPTILMGLSTIRGIFDKSILKKMATLNQDPIIFPLLKQFVSPHDAASDGVDLG